MPEHFQFSSFELNKEIDRIKEDNPFAAEDIQKNRFLIKEAYRKAASYYNNKGIYDDYEGHVTILGYVLGDVVQENLTPDESLLYMSQNKHSQYFENFVGEGSSIVIQDALSKYGFYLDELKGLRYADDKPFYAGGGRIRVEQDWIKDTNDSPWLEDFRIYVDNKLVYSKGDKGLTLMQKIEEFNKGNIGVGAPIVNQKGYVGSYELETQARNGHIVSIRVTNKGRIYAYDKTTKKFAKVNV